MSLSKKRFKEDCFRGYSHTDLKQAIKELKEEILKLRPQDFHETPYTLVFQKIDKIFGKELVE